MLIESYADFARVYDKLLDDVDYALWSKHYLEILASNGCNPKFLVDMGCGTGNMTLALARQGLEVIGMDKSEDMLMMARDKALRDGREELLFVQMDVRDFRLPMHTDAMVCVNDVVNYLLREEDVLNFFTCAYAWLKPNAGLVFDISTPYKLRAMDAGVYYDDREDVTLLWNNELQGNILEMELAVFCMEKDGRYSRFDERHKQRVWELEDLEGLLEEAGFRDVQTYGGMEMRLPEAEDERIHFFARK